MKFPLGLLGSVFILIIMMHLAPGEASAQHYNYYYTPTQSYNIMDYHRIPSNYQYSSTNDTQALLNSINKMMKTTSAQNYQPRKKSRSHASSSTYKYNNNLYKDLYKNHYKQQRSVHAWNSVINQKKAYSYNIWGY